MKRREILGALIAVPCFAAAVYCAVLRGSACSDARHYDLAAGRTERLNCRSAGPSYGTPREAFWINRGTWLFWLGAIAGGAVFTWGEGRPPKR
jgi:hypothetical protein